MIRCTNCNTPNRDTAQYCAKCGALLTATPPHQFPLGSALHNRYKITRIIGQGETATIYLAQDTNLASRECMVKEMPDQFTDIDPEHADELVSV